MMRALELDYLQAARRPRLALFALAAFAVAFAADSAVHYRALRRDVAEKELRLAKSAAARPRITPAREAVLTAEERASARDIARRLSIPWNALFLALEAARTDGVALLAIEPDAGGRTVLLSAEAKDYQAVLAFVANLEQQKALARVHLSRHEIRRGAPHAVAFSVSAAWEGER